MRTKKRNVCKKCAQLGIEIPVRIKSSIEFLDCSICTYQVKFEAIFCNLCQHWVHPYCNDITRKELENLSQASETWHCQKCNLNIYPNNIITMNKSDAFHNNRKPNTIKNEFTTFDDFCVMIQRPRRSTPLPCTTRWRSAHGAREGAA